MKTAEAMSKQYLRRTDDGLHYIIVSDAIKMAKKYAQERTKDFYPKEFVEWMFRYDYYKVPDGYCSLTVDLPQCKSLDELFIYWRDKIK